MGTEHPSQMEDLFDRLDAVELPPLGHAVPAAVLIDAIVAMPTGGFCAEVRTESFAEAKQLPKVLLIDGCLYGLTGWSPDRSVASYKTTVLLGWEVKVGPRKPPGLRIPEQPAFLTLHRGPR